MKMNVRLLRRVQKQIVKNPDSFDMRIWRESTDGYIDIISCKGWKDIVSCKGWKRSVCGTVACIGGWVEVLTKTRNSARRLGLDAHESDRLFFLGGWPYRFSDRYKSAKTYKTAAKVASERIDHFIETKGTE